MSDDTGMFPETTDVKPTNQADQLTKLMERLEKQDKEIQELKNTQNSNPYSHIRQQEEEKNKTIQEKMLTESLAKDSVFLTNDAKDVLKESVSILMENIKDRATQDQNKIMMVYLMGKIAPDKYTEEALKGMEYNSLKTVYTKEMGDFTKANDPKTFQSLESLKASAEGKYFEMTQLPLSEKKKLGMLRLI